MDHHSKYLFGIGFIVAIAVNADTIRIFNVLTQNEALREEYVKQAVNVVGNEWEAYETKCSELKAKQVESSPNGNNKDSTCNPLDVVKSQVPEVMSVVGWDETTPLRQNPNLQNYMLSFAGWLLTAFALSLGGPFWFDLLQKIVQVRTSIRPVNQEASDKRTKGGAKAVQGLIRPGKLPEDQISGLEKFSSFEADNIGYSLVNALWCARLCNLVYNDKVVVEAQIQDWGGTAIFGEHQQSNTQYVVMHDNRAAVLAFRGTETKEIDDIVTDVKFQHTDVLWKQGDVAVSKMKLHSGFAVAIDQAWGEVVASLQYPISRGLPIWVSGHSLGGALAVLAAYRLLQPAGADTYKAGDVTIGGVYTFGQPRVGNQLFADTVGALLAGRFFRAVNNRDIVPLVPLPVTPNPLHLRDSSLPENYEYAHFGSVIYFNELGQAMIDPPVWYLGLDKVVMPEDKDDLKAKLQETVGDHDMAGYIASFRQAVGLKV